MIAEVSKTVHIHYYALLREERGLSEEAVKTKAKTASELFVELNQKHRFTLPASMLKVSINNTFQAWDASLSDRDKVAFIPPIAGG